MTTTPITCEPTDEPVAACTSCHARNYESTLPGASKDKIVPLYQVRIQHNEHRSSVFHMCDECLRRLSNAIYPHMSAKVGL